MAAYADFGYCLINLESLINVKNDARWSPNGPKMTGYVQFYFRNTQSQQVVKYYMYDANLQDVLDLFKRFEFQVGEHLEDIDETMVEEIENTEK